MKFLMIFIDMLRPGLLNVYDNSNKENRIDRQLKRWGGTVYTNCYTPAPDTPRSTGCMWTSRYPKDNGCDNRLKYPYFYLKNECIDLLTLLNNKAKYQFNCYMHEKNRKVGELPLSASETGNYSGNVTLEEYLKKLIIQENSLTYLCLDDFHNVITDCYAQKKYISLGYEKIGGALELIQRYLDIDQFDLTILFSDHGFKFRDEPYWNNYYSQLNDDRTQIFMMVHKKGDREVVYNDKLSTIMDIYPTICKCARIDVPVFIEGIDLFEEEEKEYIIIEDHRTFNVELGQTIEYWAIKTKKGLACIDSNKKWAADYEITETEMQMYEKVLEEKGSCFAENVKLQMIKNSYDDFLVSYLQYYDGEPRIVRRPISETLKNNISTGIKKAKRVKHLIKGV